MISETVSSLSGEFVTVEQIFQDGLKIDENKFSNVWLTDLPHLARECSTRTLTSVLSDVVKVGENYFQVENETFRDIAKLLVPKQFPKKFPVVETSGGKISRILLRRELIKRWNKRIESLGRYGYDVPSKEIVLSAAGGLGKSIDLYLFAVFAKHCRIPVQYIGNTSEWLDDKHMSKFVMRYLKMLLFMNADILDELPNFETTYYDSLSGAPLKSVIYFAIKQKDMSLAMDIRRFMTQMEPRNFLIVDEHNALWRKFGKKIRSWPEFFASYTNLEAMRTRFCGILIAGSQHHAFEETLPSGYARAKEYVEPLNFEEFDLWQRLTDYPQILREHQEEVIELTGLVPRMIAEMVSIAREENPNSSFEQVETKFRNNIYSVMKTKHDKYVNSLTVETGKADFVKMLDRLFLGERAPELLICDGAYRDRGLLIAMNDGTLRFYNSLARDVLLSSFRRTFASDSNLAKLVEIYRTERSTRGQTFEQLFFIWCIKKKGEVTIRSDNKPNRTLSFDCSAWVRLDRGQFNPQVKKFTHSCWISLGERYPRFDYIYVHIVGFQWHIYFFQVSVSPFSRHDRGYAAFQNALLPPPSARVNERNDPSSESSSDMATSSRDVTDNEQMLASGCRGLRHRNVGSNSQLSSLLRLILNEEFTIVLDQDGSGETVDFHLLDSKENDHRDCISIVYVTPLTFQEAKGASSVPKYVEFLCFEGFPESFQNLIDLKHT